MRNILRAVGVAAASTALVLGATDAAYAQNTHDDHSVRHDHSVRDDHSTNSRDSQSGCAGQRSVNLLTCVHLGVLSDILSA